MTLLDDDQIEQINETMIVLQSTLSKIGENCPEYRAVIIEAATRSSCAVCDNIAANLLHSGFPELASLAQTASNTIKDLIGEADAEAPDTTVTTMV